MEITCVYRNKDYEMLTMKFDSYGIFGKWVADNAEEIIIITVLQVEE